MRWCMLVGGRADELKSSGALLCAPLASEPLALSEGSPFALSGQEGCMEASLSSGGGGFISHLHKTWS